MSKGQRGNKEAKKPKQTPRAVQSTPPVAVAPAVPAVVPDRYKKK
jgi:hypothetical protein